MTGFIVIDTETSGLFDFSKPADADGQPRLATLHMILVSQDLQEEGVVDLMVRPEGWVMSEEASRVNGLSMERLLAEGIPIADALAQYVDLVDAGRVVVAFNAQYDTKVMRGELRRAKMPDRFEHTPNICVMRPLAEICKILRANGRSYKFPKLSEACEHFGIVNDGAHTAGGDARAALQIFLKLHELKLCSEPSVAFAKERVPA